MKYSRYSVKINNLPSKTNNFYLEKDSEYTIKVLNESQNAISATIEIRDHRKYTLQSIAVLVRAQSFCKLTYTPLDQYSFKFNPDANIGYMELVVSINEGEVVEVISTKIIDDIYSSRQYTQQYGEVVFNEYRDKPTIVLYGILNTKYNKPVEHWPTDIIYKNENSNT